MRILISLSVDTFPELAKKIEAAAEVFNDPDTSKAGRRIAWRNLHSLIFNSHTEKSKAENLT